MSVAGQWRGDSGLTVVHVTALQKISNEEAQDLLAGFIAAIEPRYDQSSQLPTTTDTYYTEEGVRSNNISNAVTQQLRRIDRDLCGLPPLQRKRKVDAVVANESGDLVDFAGVEDVEMEDLNWGTTEENKQEATQSAQIDKLERKRLKKERQKKEKKMKEMAKSQLKED